MSTYRTLTSALAFTAALVLPLTAACNDKGERAAVRPGASASSSASPSPTVTPNGIERRSAAQIVKAMRKATAAASTLRFQGTVKDGKETFGLDFRYAGPKRVAGRLTMNGQRIELIRIGNVIYMKGDRAFWRGIGGKRAARMFSGKYLKATTKDKDFGEIASFSDVSELLKPDGPVEKGEAATINGRRAIALDADGGKLFVATEGEPVALRLDAGADGHIDFDYESPVVVKAPPKDRVVSVTDLGRPTAT